MNNKKEERDPNEKQKKYQQTFPTAVRRPANEYFLRTYSIQSIMAILLHLHSHE